MDGQTQCAICLESLMAEGHGRQTLSCGHILHELCVLEMRRYGASGRCPYCRACCADLKPVDELLSNAGLCRARRQFQEELRVLDEVLSIEPGNILAKNNLGYLHQQGHGVDQNFEKAFELFQEAFQGGSMEAANNLGRMYQNAQGVDQNFSKAFKFFKDAQAAGIVEATSSLGIMHLKGLGVQLNFVTAAEHFQEAYQHGCPGAATNLGYMYQEGKGVAQDFKRARELFMYGRQYGSSAAPNSLGFMFQHGIGISKNLRTAVAFFEEAHHLGCPEGTHNLGTMHMKGQGVTTNSKKGIQLCKEALKKGYVDSDPSWPGLLALLDARFSDSDQGVEETVKNETDSFTSVRPTVSSASHSWQRPDPHDVEAGIAASSDEVASYAATQNGQVADAILRSRNAESKVILLEFSRNPQAYHRTLLGCDELRECRDALKACGFSPELDAHAKIFVPPEMFKASIEAVRLGGWKLEARHVLTAPELEEIVVQVVKRGLRNAEKVRCKGRHTIPTAFAAASAQSDHQIEVSRTFINVKIPNSLRSEISGYPVTASTTDARAQCGKNPRAA